MTASCERGVCPCKSQGLSEPGASAALLRLGRTGKSEALPSPSASCSSGNRPLRLLGGRGGGIEASGDHIGWRLPEQAVSFGKMFLESECPCALHGQGLLLLSKRLGQEWAVALVRCFPVHCMCPIKASCHYSALRWEINSSTES